MSVQVKGSGTIGGLDEGLNIVGVVTATSFSGSGANLTSLPAANLTGTLPAISGANLTGITTTIINNNGSNRIITGSSTANTLEGESTFTYNGTHISKIDTDQTYATFQLDGNAGGAIEFYENGTRRFELYGIDAEVALYDRDKGAYHTRFKSGGNVEISDGKLLIGTTTAGTGSGDDLTISNSSNMGLTLRSTSSNYCNIYFSDATAGTATYEGYISYNHATDSLEFATLHVERLRIMSDGRFGFNTSSPSDYALATFNSANGILLQGDGQSRILMRNNTGGTNEKMMDIQCNGNINFRTINDDYTTATTRATFRTDGNFVVGNRVGTSSPSTNQPVAFHSARVTPDGMTSTVSNGVRCNLYVGSNEGWASGDGGVIGMGGSRAGSAGQEAIWSYIKGSRQSGNGWEYAGKMELGTTEWGTYNMTKAMTIFADNQVRLHGDDNSMMTFDVGGALRLIIEHTGGGNMRLRNLSSGTVTYSTSSDYRLKENATTINNALTTIKSLKPYQFTWKHDNKLGQGFFAHEAQAVLPDIGVVSGTKDEVQLEDDTKHDGQWKKDDPIYQSVDYSKLVPLLTAALQEETAKREALEARVAALESS
tara:strand:+ start:319 stop:2112 length:1794 start_codon:yes stop_codon:yes gene_type:complete